MINTNPHCCSSWGFSFGIELDVDVHQHPQQGNRDCLVSVFKSQSVVRGLRGHGGGGTSLYSIFTFLLFAQLLPYFTRSCFLRNSITYRFSLAYFIGDELNIFFSLPCPRPLRDFFRLSHDGRNGTLMRRRTHD